jgi:TRAP-type mannitol/chloroaromatic compound transport system permease small subunit
LKAGPAAAEGWKQPAVRVFALCAAALGFVFVINSYLTYWHGWPGAEGLVGHYELLGFEPPIKPIKDGDFIYGIIQLLFNLLTIVGIIFYVGRTRQRTLLVDAEKLTACSAYLARAAFWAVLLVGFTDAVISFLQVEGFLGDVVGEQLAKDLGISRVRGAWVHLPLIAAGLIIAIFNKSLGFVWLALLVVVAELQIVLLRFIFSYEQAFMADLVRFWYAAMFLFGSAYTLLHEGHVRVDVLYSGFNTRRKAWVNTFGAIFLGAPVCWIVLTMGLANNLSVISGPILSYEISQSSFGMYVKYLLAGYLLIFALTMLLEFMSVLLKNAGILLGEPDSLEAVKKTQHEEPVHA